jgi:hypothetical protein
VCAQSFYNGKLCGLASYDGAERCGYIHLLQAGSVTLLGPDRNDFRLTLPSLIFMPRPSRHQLFADDSEGAQLLCASMEFEGGIDNPLSASLPDCLVLPLDELPMLADTLNWMFGEAAGAHCGREAALDRLFELLIILLFRHLLDHHQLRTAMMVFNGLFHLKIFCLWRIEGLTVVARLVETANLLLAGCKHIAGITNSFCARLELLGRSNPVYPVYSCDGRRIVPNFTSLGSGCQCLLKICWDVRLGFLLHRG